MSRNLVYVCLYLGLIYMVSSMAITKLDLTSDETTTPGPATTPPQDVDEDSDGLDPMQVLLDAAVAIEENVYNNNPLSSDSIPSNPLSSDSVSSNPILENDGNEMDPLV